MKFTNLLLIFLILLLPFTAEASETHTLVIKDKDGNVIPKEKQAYIPSKSDYSDKKESVDGTKDKTQKNIDPNTKAGEAMILNALMELPYSIADEFQEGGFKLVSAGIEKNVTGSKKIQYSLYSNELDPFAPPFVNDLLTKTGAIYYACAIIFICMAYWAFVTQYTFPQIFGNLQESISGEESYFDFHALIRTWAFVIAGPAVQYYFIKGLITSRNVLVLSMTTTMIDSINTSSDSLPTYVITRVGWYFNGLQKLIGEYGVYLIVSLIFISCAVYAVLAIFISFKSAMKTAFIVNFYLVLLVLMDIVTLFFVSFGIELGNFRENWIYVLPGIIMAVIADFLILIIPTLILLFGIKRKYRSINIVGF